MELGSYDTSPRAISLKASDSGFLSAARAISTAVCSWMARSAHHVVDVVRALGSERAQQETIVVSLVQQDVDLRFDNAHMRVNLVFSRLVR